MKKTKLKLVLLIFTSLIVSCSNDNLIETNVSKNSPYLLCQSAVECTEMITPEENELIITDAIVNIVEGNTDCSTFLEEYSQLVGSEEITVTHNTEELYAIFLSAYDDARSSISDIHNEDELLEYFQLKTNWMYSDSFYSILIGLVRETCMGEIMDMDYNQFSREEAYLLSNAVAMCKSLNYFNSIFMQVAYESNAASDCWDELVDEIVELVGFSAAGAIISGITAAGVAFVTGPGILVLGIASLASGVLTTAQLCRNVKAIYVRYAECLEQEAIMSDYGLLLDWGEESDSEAFYDDEDMNNRWNQFLRCHIIRFSVLREQVFACLNSLNSIVL